MTETGTAHKKAIRTEPEEKFIHFPTYHTWKKIGFSPRFGSLVPLSYIRSARNQGVGDFADIELLKDLFLEIGASIIQLLPINDMGRGKVPYSSISAFALDPIYVALDRIEEMKENRSQEVNEYITEHLILIEQQKKEKYIDIDAIRTFKFGALYRLYKDFLSRNRDWNTPRWHAFQSFIINNKFWLDDFAMFRTLKNKFNWASWQDWPAEFRDRTPDALRRLSEESADELLFVKYVQWIAYSQMRQAHNECLADNVLIKGDIPLQVDFESADVWAHPEYFNLNACAGAPPDQYSQMGQNWGTPTYNWDRLALDNYVLWRKRLEYASHFFDIFRIDHVVGLFRIWTIPITTEFPRGVPSGWNGYFDPEDLGEGAHKPVWENHGRTLLKMMTESCEMLPIAEDLGTIPYVCRSVLEEMGIPGYKVLIWERAWHKQDAPFYNPEEYSYISMSTSTTHDFWTLPGYWTYNEKDTAMEKEHQASLRAMWKFLMGKKEYQQDYTDELHIAILEKLFHSGSIFMIMPFADLWGKIPGVYGFDIQADRINDPGDPERGANWTGRMPINIEDFKKHYALKQRIKILRRLASESGRLRGRHEGEPE